MAVKCCSKRAAKLKKVSFEKAKKAADARVASGAPEAKAKKATARKASAKKAKPCTICAKGATR